jgi:hypothetical protein
MIRFFIFRRTVTGRMALFGIRTSRMNSGLVLDAGIVPVFLGDTISREHRKIANEELW